MASMKDIKSRIKSVESTRQITKAMELVASSKLRKARERADLSRPFFTELYGALRTIAASNTDFTSDYLVQRPVKKSGYVLIAGDRGLAGGYNNNMFKLFTQHREGKDVCVIPVGKKAVEFCKRRNLEIITEDYALVEDLTIGACSEIGEIMSDMYKKGEIDEFYLGYTIFVSMLSQKPDIIKVLPITNINSELTKDDGEKAENKMHTVTVYDPDMETLFDKFVPQYISGLTWGAITDSWASELSARRTAMDSASKNADAMVSGLSLQYNRARQAAITQEITEIVSGAGEA